MSWASKRQFIIIASIVTVVVALIAVTVIAIVYETPSCSDGKQNADETGIDCGGSCTYVCSVDVEVPTIRFARAFAPQAERYDVIAYIDNRNPTLAAKGVRVTAELYDNNRVEVGRKEVSIDIPPGATVPVYIPEAHRGNTPVAQVFLTFDSDTLKFFEPAKKHVVPLVVNVEMMNTDTPRIHAILQNPTAFALYDIKPIATVFDTDGNAIAASQTFLPQLGAQADATVIFTWNAPFLKTPARVEVLPILPLPLP